MKAIAVQVTGLLCGKAEHNRNIPCLKTIALSRSLSLILIHPSHPCETPLDFVLTGILPGDSSGKLPEEVGLANDPRIRDACIPYFDSVLIG